MIEAGRVAVVTGGSRGIGRAIAVELAKSGADIAITYRSNDEEAQKAKSLVEEVGKTCRVYKGDSAKSEDVDAVFKQIAADFGRLDILVNNAGITRDNLMMRMKEAEFDDVISTNLKGAYLCAKAATRQMMRARWGRVVNITSVVGLMGNAGQANYAASKAGVIGLTKSVAREYAARGITANAVAPGYVATELTGELTEEVREVIKNQTVLGRFAEAEEIAAAVAFLCGESAGYITGQTLAVDGGMTMQ